MEHNDIVNTIKFLRPDCEFVLRGNEIEWLDAKSIQPTADEIEAGWSDYKRQLAEKKHEIDLAKEKAEAKLVALGLTANDLKALGLA